MRSVYGVDTVAIEVVILTYMLTLLFTFWSTLLINFIAIRFGAIISFITNYLGLLVLSMMALYHEKIPFIKGNTLFLFLNPVANVTINWHDAAGQGFYSVLYFIVLIAVTMLLGGKMITIIDISLENKERNN
jgi:hypothetical protein